MAGGGTDNVSDAHRPRKLSKIFLLERRDDLELPVGAEVHINDRVIRLHGYEVRSFDGCDVVVGLLIFRCLPVPGLRTAAEVTHFLRNPLRVQVVGEFGTVLVLLVAVHGVVPPDEGNSFCFGMLFQYLLKFGIVLAELLHGNIAPVADEMQVDAFHSFLLCKFNERMQVIRMPMHPPVGVEAEKMEYSPLRRTLAGTDKYFVLEELS